MKKWSPRTLGGKLIKTGAKVVRHSRYVVFQRAEVVVPKALFSEILERIGVSWGLSARCMGPVDGQKR